MSLCLCQRNVLNPLDEGMKMVLPTFAPLSPRLASVPLHDELVYADQYVEWTLYVVFACPAILIRPEVLMLFTQLAKGMLVVPLYADHMLDLHHEAELLAKTYLPKSFNVVVPKTLKLKKDFAELAKVATTSAGAMRRERRSYLQGELSNLAALFRDVPGLIAPKFPMALAALAMAQAEVRYYFAHLRYEVPKARAKLYKFEDYFDPQISYLVGAASDLIQLVKTHKAVVQSYYTEYLQGAHRKAVEKLAEAVKGVARAGLSDIVDALPETLAASDFEVMRLDWGRAHAVLMSKESASIVRNPGMVDLVHRMRLVGSHSLYADSVDHLLATHCELTSMWHFKTSLSAIFSQCLASTDDTPRCCLAFFHVLATVADSVHESCPVEQLQRGAEAAKMAQELMGELSKRIDAILKEVFKQMVGLDAQTAPVEAAYRYERQVAAGPSGLEEQWAGFESIAENARFVGPVTGTQISAVHLFSAIASADEEIVVFDRIFRPKELVKVKVQAFLRETYRRECAGSGEVPPPTTLARAFTIATQTLQIVLAYIDFDIGAMIRKVRLLHCLVCHSEAGQWAPYLTCAPSRFSSMKPQLASPNPTSLA